jgi:hypothetical protein
MLVAFGSGCSWLWPAVVPTSPKAPLFHSSFPLVGGLRTDGALCSLVSLGPDATLVVSKPESLEGAVPLESACQEPPRPSGRLVRVDTAEGTVHGVLFGVSDATGVLVAFSGLGMPAGGWINQRFAAAAALRGFTTFAPVRDESARPIYFDPLREARRALAAAGEVAVRCRIREPRDLAFVGESLGGMEALLANREALRREMNTRAVVLDPLLDARLAASHLDSFWHGLGVDAVQGYFRRILTGRYGEDPPPKFEDLLDRTPSRPGSATRLDADAPSVWLCDARREAYVVFLSDTDPALGDAQRDFGKACKFPFREAHVPGHVPLACRLELFREMVEELVPPPRSGGSASLARPEAEDLSQDRRVDAG